MTGKIPNLHHTKSKGTTYYRYKCRDGHYEPLGKDYDTAAIVAK